ncbi:MAG: GNAT family N-acetyltransferase [Thermomicrobiales bacterium]
MMPSQSRNEAPNVTYDDRQPGFTITAYTGALPPALQEQYERVGAESFGSDSQTPEERQEEHDRFCSERDIFVQLLALAGDTVVGAASVFQRTIMLHYQPVRLGGLGGVCTATAWRRLGVAAALVQRAMAELRAAGCDLAYLCTDVESEWAQRLYGRAGFVPIGRPYTFRGKSGKRYTDHDGMIAPLASPQIFQQVLADTAPLDLGAGNW